MKILDHSTWDDTESDHISDLTIVSNHFQLQLQFNGYRKNRAIAQSRDLKRLVAKNYSGFG